MLPHSKAPSAHGHAQIMKCHSVRSEEPCSASRRPPSKVQSEIPRCDGNDTVFRRGEMGFGTVACFCIVASPELELFENLKLNGPESREYTMPDNHCTCNILSDSEQGSVKAAGQRVPGWQRWIPARAQPFNRTRSPLPWGEGGSGRRIYQPDRDG